MADDRTAFERGPGRRSVADRQLRRSRWPASGALHPDQLDITEPGQPRPQLSIADGCGGELGDAEQTAAFVERGCDMDIEVGLHAPGDSARMVIVIPFRFICRLG
jgi:hypothetical protein